MARVSSEEQAKGFSLDIQKQKLEEHCKREGIKIKYVIREDHSAKNFNRPEWKNLIELLGKPNHGVDLILITSWDRFSRNLHEALIEMEWLRSKGVSVMAIDQPLDMSIPENKLMLAIYLTVPEVDNDRRSIKIREGMRAALKAGRWCRVAPKGYKNSRDGQNRPIIVPNEEAKWVKYAFEQIIAGWSQSDVLRVFSDNQIKLQSNGLSKLLRNPVYVGKIIVPSDGENAAYLVDGVHDPIVSEELFQMVQEELSRRQQIPVKSKHKPKELFPLRGILHCSKCEKRVTASFSRGKSGKRHGYYHCNYCRKERHPAAKVHSMLESVMAEFQFSKGVQKLYDAILKETLGTDKKKDEKEISRLKKDLEKQQTRGTKLQDLLMDGALQAPDYSEMKMRCESEVRNIERKLSKLEEKDVELAPKLEKSVHLLHNMSNTFKVAGNQQKAALIRAIFPESVVFDGTRCRTPRLNSVLELLLNIDRGFGENKKGRTLKNLEFSLLVEPAGVSTPPLTPNDSRPCAA